jgi:hypothetical protein
LYGEELAKLGYNLILIINSQNNNKVNKEDVDKKAHHLSKKKLEIKL